MQTFSQFIDDIEDVVDDAIADVDPNTIGVDIDAFLSQGTNSLTDILTGESILSGDISNALIDLQPILQGIDPDDIAGLVDTVLPFLGGPFGFAPVLSIATDLLTGQTIGELVGDGLDLWFNRDSYLANNPDVANASVDPFLHFLQSGALESRLPDFFDENFYLASNPDVGAAVASDAFSSGWVHFLTNGAKEGRLPAPGVGNDVVGAVSNTLDQLSSIGLL